MFSKLRQAREVIDALLARAPDAGGRAALLAEMLQFLWPGEALSACVLRQGGETAAAALDEAGASRTPWAALLQDELAHRAAAGAAAAPRVPLLDALGLAGVRLVQTEVRYRDRVYGALLLAVPKDGEAQAEAVRTLLTTCACHLAVCLEIEAREAEAADNVRMAEIGEASIPVAHEFNNFLNALLLHTAVLKLRLPEPLQQSLEDIRRQALAAATLIQQMQHYRRRPAAAATGADLNRAVREAAAQEADQAAAPAVSVRLDLAAELPPTPGGFGDLKRLCAFLIRNAAAAAARGPGEVVVRTAWEGTKTVLRVEDNGPSLTAAELPRLFEPAQALREGTNALELAACKTLGRRLQASVRAEQRPEGGVAVVVEWAEAGN